MKQSGKKRLSISLAVVVLPLYLVFLAGYGVALLAPSVSPLRTHIPALFNLAFGILLLFLLFFLVYFLFHWRKALFLLLFHLLLIVLTWGCITAYFPLNPFGGLEEKRDLRVMTYNAEHFSRRLTKDSEPYVVGVVRAYRPDIVCLQESASLKALRKYFGEEYPYIAANAAKGLGLLSKYPILESHPVEYESYTNGSESYLIEIEGRRLLLINNHLQSYGLTVGEKDKYRGYIEEIRPKQFLEQIREVVGRLAPDMNLRAKAAEATRKDLERSRAEHLPDYTLVVGDFNDTPNSFVYSVMKGGDLRDAYRETGFGPGISYNEKFLPFRIDHILYDGDLEAAGGLIPWNREASDHNPVLIDFNLGQK